MFRKPALAAGFLMRSAAQDGSIGTKKASRGKHATLSLGHWMAGRLIAAVTAATAAASTATGGPGFSFAGFVHDQRTSL